MQDGAVAVAAAFVAAAASGACVAAGVIAGWRTCMHRRSLKLYLYIVYCLFSLYRISS